jgi:antitoxin ParD1/3/4
MNNAEKLSITLPSEMVAIIKSEVDAGRYASTSEVLRDAMRGWIRTEQVHNETLVNIRARIFASLDDPRPSVPLDEAFKRLEAKFIANAHAAE